MEIVVSGKQVHLSDALRARVAHALEQIAGKYFDHAMEAQVTFGRARSFFTCDINFHAGRRLVLRGEGEAADANAAFDDAAEHVAKRLRRYRRRLNEHARTLAHRARPEPARQYVLRPDSDEEAALQEARGPGAAEWTGTDGGVDGTAADRAAFAAVVAEAPVEIDRLSVSEAVMRLDLADQMVMMFRNSASGELNVIYRRQDGNIGWIDPGARQPARA